MAWAARNLGLGGQLKLRKQIEAAQVKNRGEMRTKVGPNYNLQVRYPKIAAQWHPTLNRGRKPMEFAPFSGVRVTWLCSENAKHAWEATIASRTQGGNGCGYCQNKLVNSTNSLATLQPEIARSWHPTKNGKLFPQDVVPGSQKKVWWQCLDNPEHSWITSTGWRTKGTGCPYCSRSTSLLEVRIFCELKVLFPAALHRHRIGSTEADIYLPQNRIAVEVDGFHWHQEKTALDKRKNLFFSAQRIQLFRVRGQGLPKTSTRDTFFEKKEDQLRILNRLAKKMLLHGSFIKLDRTRLNRYISTGQFVGDALFLKLSKRINSPMPGTSLLERYPAIATEWHPTLNGNLHPKHTHHGSSRRIWWVCSKNKKHHWESSVAHRTGRSKSGCLYCAGKLVLPGDSLSVLYPELAKEWHPTKNAPLTTVMVSPGSSRKVWWVCNQNKSHVWNAVIIYRVQKFKSASRGCPFCSGRRCFPEISIAAKHPRLAREWHPTKNRGITPWELSPGSEKKPWWRCSKRKNHPAWQALVYNRANGARCPACGNEERGRSISRTLNKLKRQGHPRSGRRKHV